MSGIKINRDVELNDGNIILKPHRPEYIDYVYEAVTESTAEIMPWMSWLHLGYSIDETGEWLESRAAAWNGLKDFDFAVFCAKDGSFLGNCGLNHIELDNKFANLGYWVRTSRTGRGTATAATRLLAGFGFDNIRMNRVEIVAAAGNKASQRVAEKAGAAREGVLRNRLCVRGKVYDAVLFSLIPSDHK